MERREALITGLVLGVASVIIAAIVATGWDSADDSSRADAADPTLVPTPTTTADDPVDPDPEVELADFVDEAIAFIEDTRGAAFETRPEVVVLGDADFVARVDGDLEADFAEDPDALEQANAVYRATGLIRPGDSVDDVVREFGAAGILGFYDPETDELVVRQVDELSLLTKSTIVHELAHAFDDQHFDLDRPEYEDRVDEIPWTFRATAEGSASWVESRWKDGLTPEERARIIQEELSFGGDPSILDAFELSFLVYELSPYTYGEPFAAALTEGGGNEALDDALLDPAETSEQVIDPSRFASGEPPLAVAAPESDGEEQYRGVGGNALIAAMFQGSFIDRPIEWGGDELVAWTDGEESCLRWHLVADSDAGLDQLAAGFAEWAQFVGSATTELIDDDTLRVERCA